MVNICCLSDPWHLDNWGVNDNYSRMVSLIQEAGPFSMAYLIKKTNALLSIVACMWLQNNVGITYDTCLI